MADLKQHDADRLLQMAKQAANTSSRSFPSQGGTLEVPLIAVNGHEKFMLNVNRNSQIEAKITYQTRALKTVILARLDFGAEHRNPDGVRVGSPHLHVYTEGYDDKWAYELPHEDFASFNGANDLDDWFNRFLDFCQIRHDNVISGRMIV